MSGCSLLLMSSCVLQAGVVSAVPREFAVLMFEALKVVYLPLPHALLRHITSDGWSLLLFGLPPKHPDDDIGRLRIGWRLHPQLLERLKESELGMDLQVHPGPSDRRQPVGPVEDLRRLLSAQG